MSCRYDRETGDYLADGEPCRRDDYGDPTYHCTARRTCAQHVGPSDLTCARCIGRARNNLRRIVDLAATGVLDETAVEDGVNSEAANLAGPAADPRAVAETREYVRHHVQAGLMSGRIDEERAIKILDALPDDDDRHPMVLTRWQMMLAEDWGDDLPPKLTITGAADYLDRHLGKLAQAEDQDFALFATDMRRVRTHLENAIHDGAQIDRGVPCPECGADDGAFVRLVREYGHWCERPDCTHLHYLDDSGDTWVCPRDRAHSWTNADYARLVERVS